jgi:predicted dehydrogenase
MNIGIIGCGNIFDQYMSNAPRFEHIQISVCASRGMDSARAKAEQYGLQAMTVDELIHFPDIGMIINLSIPEVHAELTLRALNAGKHVFSEKPLGVTLKEARQILDTAEAKGLRVGCAPDTILGDSHQACRKLLDEGAIGDVLSGTAFMMSQGPEAWHPNPGFFYQFGGGPMLDIGPYYITALINFLGPVKSVAARTRNTFPERTAGHESIKGQKIPVEVPTHYAGVLEFECGALITCVMSWDVWNHDHTPIELYGTEGSLQMSDPNMFGRALKIATGHEPFAELPQPPARFADRNRLVGAAEMADAISAGRPHICSGEMAFHALEVMYAFEESSRNGGLVEIQSRCERPALLPDNL